MWMPLVVLLTTPLRCASDPGPVQVQSAELTAEGPLAHLELVLRLGDEDDGPPRDRVLVLEHPSDEAALVQAAVRVVGRPWRPATLVDAAEAGERFEAFRSALYGGGEGLLDEQGPALQVTADDGGGSTTVEVLAHESVGPLEVRVRFRLYGSLSEGRYQVARPRLSDGEEALATLKGARERRVLPTGFNLVEDGYLSWPAPAQERWTGRWAVASGGGQVLYRAEVEALGSLGTHRRPTSTIYVVDQSASFDPEQRRLALELIEEMLRRSPPGSRWGLLTFDREPRVRVSPGAPVTDRGPLRGLRQLPAANGSELATALLKAHQLAADADPELDPRVVLLGDLQVRRALREEPVAQALAAGPARVHVVEIGPVAGLAAAELGWRRVEEGSVKEAAERTGGLHVELPMAQGDSVHPRSLLGAHLVSPQLLDHVRLEGLGRSDLLVLPEPNGSSTFEGLVGPDRILAGGESGAVQGLLDVAVVRDASGPAALWGEAWTQAVRIDLRPDAQTHRTLAAVALQGQLADQLSADLASWLAHQTGAPGPGWVLLALPDAEPPPRDGVIGLGGFGCCCCCGGSSCCGWGRRGVEVSSGPTAHQQLQDQLESARDRCAPLGSAPPELVVEVQSLEVLAVGFAEVSGTEQARRCWEEAIWAVSLPSLANPREFADWKELRLRTPARRVAERAPASATPTGRGPARLARRAAPLASDPRW